MNPIALAYLVMALATPAQQQGVAKFYRPGLMETVAARRGIEGAHYTSSVNCADIGSIEYATLYDPVHQVWSPLQEFVVADCSAPQDRARHIREGLVMEVDYRSAVWAHFQGEGKTRAIVWRWPLFK